MSAYTQPIIRYGLVTPLIFNCVLLAAVGAGVNKLSKVRAEKEERYKEQTARLAVVQKLEEELSPRRGQFADEKTLMEADQRQLFTQILDTTLKNYETVELERRSLVFPIEGGSIGKQVKCETARVKTSFQGGFGPMQETLLQLESLMPQALLEDMKVVRTANPLLNRPDHLIVDTTHSSWRKEEKSP